MRFSRISTRHLLGVIALGAGAFSANGCGASIVVIECDDGLELCDQRCVDLDRSEDHCGGCDERCEGGTCVDGDCRPPAPQPCLGPDCEPGCSSGFTTCGDTCVNLQDDATHCGACFASCPDEQVCSQGECSQVCTCDRCDVIELPSEVDVTRSGTTTGGVDGYAPGCSGEGAPDVAYHFVAPISGQYVFDTDGSAFDTVVAVLADCSEVACVDDTELGTSAATSMLLEAGQDVVIVVDGYGGDSGEYVLRVRQDDGTCVGTLTDCDGVCVDLSSDPSHCGGCFFTCESFCTNFTCECEGPGCGCEFPVCGSCGFVADLGSEIPIRFAGSTDALADDLQPSCVGSEGPEALHLFTAPLDGDYVFDTLGSSFDTVLTVLDAASCGEQACNDDFINLDSQVVVTLRAGQQIYVSVDGLEDSGFYNLNGNLLRAER